LCVCVCVCVCVAEVQLIHIPHYTNGISP